MGMNAAKESLCHFFTSFLLLDSRPGQEGTAPPLPKRGGLQAGDTITYCASFYTYF